MTSTAINNIAFKHELSLLFSVDQLCSQTHHIAHLVGYVCLTNATFYKFSSCMFEWASKYVCLEHDGSGSSPKWCASLLKFYIFYICMFFFHFHTSLLPPPGIQKQTQKIIITALCLCPYKVLQAMCESCVSLNLSYDQTQLFLWHPRGITNLVRFV